MTITLNGDEREVGSGTTVEALIVGLGLDPRAVAVEHNGEILRRGRFEAVEVRAGDRLELVRFVQGG